MSLAALWRRYLGEGEPRLASPAGLARRLARVQLQAARHLAPAWAGAYRSAFKGEGIEFSGVREYEAGDDVRAIDWRVTARTGRLAIRRYVEERNRTVLFLLDVGPALAAGSGERCLLDVAADVVALVGSAALAGGDRVTLAASSDRLELLLAPQRDPAALLRIVQAILRLRPGERPGNLSAALVQVPRLLPRPGILVVISPLLRPGYGPRLAVLARRHELLVVRLWDDRAGVGTARALVPVRTPSGAVGWNAPSPAPPADELAGVPADVLTATPETNLGAALARAFLDRGRRRCA